MHVRIYRKHCVDRNRKTAVFALLPVCMCDMSFPDSGSGGVGGHTHTDQG